MAKKKARAVVVKKKHTAPKPPESIAQLYISSEAYNKMASLVANFSTEIGWHGLARRVGESMYEIYDVIVYPQEVTGVNIETDEGRYGFWLMSQPDEVFPNVRMHGHSHVRMDCYPSPLDRATYEKLLVDLPADSFYIFLIMNKYGDSWAQIYDMNTQTVFTNDRVRRRIIYYDPIVKEAEQLVCEREIVCVPENKMEVSSNESD